MAEKLISKRQAGKAFETERLARSRAARAERETSTAAEELANAIMSAGTASVSGPAQAQPTSNPQPMTGEQRFQYAMSGAVAQAIQTPELDSFRNNATGNTWEDTNALARQVDAEKAREAELQKTPERNVGGGLTTRQFEQAREQGRTGTVITAPEAASTPERNTPVTRGMYSQAQETSRTEGNTPGAYLRGLVSTQDNWDTPEWLTEAESRAYQRGLHTNDVVQNLPAIIGEFGENAVDAFLYPTRERQQSALDPTVVQQAGRSGEMTGLAAIGGLGAASAGISKTVSMIEDLVTKNNVHDPLTNRVLSDYNNVQNKIAEETQDWSAGQKKAYNYAIEAFRMVPDMVMMWMTAGASAGTEGAAIANQTMNGFARYVTGLSTNPAFYSTALQVTGNSYEEALAKGADEKTAALYGTLNGILNAALEVGGMQEIPAAIKGAQFKNAMLEWLKSIPEEGMEEVTQGMVEKALGSIVLGDDGKFISVSDPDAIISLVRAVEEFEGGAIMSAALGGGNLAINSGINAYNNAANAQMQSALETTAESAENPLAQTILNNEQQEAPAQPTQEAPAQAPTVDRKQQQADLILATNPHDDSLGDHTWIRSADDVRTYEEGLSDDGIGDGDDVTPDYTAQMIEDAKRTGKITVYSSYPIEAGTFVTPSKMEAQSYAGGGQVYSQTVPTADVAWLDSIQGQYAPVAEAAAEAPAAPVTPIAQAVMNNEQQNGPLPGQLRSQSEANTIQAVDEKVGAPPEVRNPIYYSPVSENESVSMARDFLNNGYESNAPARASADITPEQGEALTAAGQRLGGNYAKAIADLQGPSSWSGVQTDMAYLIQVALGDDAARTNDWTAYEAWREIDRAHGTEGARANQARAKRTRATDIINATIDEINRLGISGDAKTKVLDEALPFAKEVERVLNSADPDPAKLRDIITRISEQRHTGTIIPGLMQKLLDGQTDMEYLADLAKASVRGFAADAIPANAGQVLKSWQSIAMLLKATTTIRNLGGNETFGFLDALVGDVFGVALDRAVSGATGKRSVAFDTRWLNSTQRQGARDAFNKAVLEIALDADINSVDTKYFPNSRTFDPGSRNPITRVLSRAEQILGYSLNASDRLFRGGIQSGATEALTNLNEVKPLTEQETAEIERKIREKNPTSKESTIERLVQKRIDEVMRQRQAALEKEIQDASQKRASYMLFQNKGSASTAARSVHDFLNLAGVGGEVQGVRRVGGFGLGDIVTPFASVPANLGVKAFEYSPAGMMKGIYDLAKVLHDAKTGKSTIAQQQNAVMEISRGVTGIPLAMAFAALIKGGLIKRSSDDDDYDVTKARQSEGRKETQWNLSATMRAIQGKSPEWQEGDKIASLSWLEPLNAFMDIGAMFAQIPEYDDDGFWKKLGYYANKGTRAYLAGAFDAFMEIPMMNNLQSAMQTFQYMDADNNLDKIFNSAEDLAKSGITGMFPGLVAQIARAMDPTTRDTSADTFIQELGNALVNQIPVARESLPEKLDSFGQPVTSNNEALNALSNLVFPGAVNEYTPKDVVQALDSVYDATGKSTFYPDYKAPNKFNYGGTDYELTTDEKRTYQENFGQRYNELMQSVIDGKLYGRMTDAERAEVFGNIRNLAAAEARGEIVTGRGGEYSSDYDKVSELSDIAGYYTAKAMLDSAAGDADKRNFSRISEVLDSYRTLTDDVKAKLAANDSTNYLDELSEAWNRGVSVENWFKAYDAKDGLTPYGDNKQVADWQRYQAMANVSTDKDMDIMLRSYMEDTAYDKYAAARAEGLSARDWADARAAAGALEPVEGKETLADWQKYEAYANVLDDKGMDAMMTGYTEGTTLENYLAAREAGASAKDWAAAMAAAGKLTPWSEDGEVKKWQKYQAYAETVDEDTADAIFSAYLTENQARLYSDARAAGVTPQQWAEANAGVARLTPYGDNKGVTEWQQYEYITRLYPDQAEALIPYFIETDGMRERFQTAMDYGVSPTLWANFYKQYSLNNGRKDASISWMLGQGYNKKQAEYMYYLFKEKVANLSSFNDKYK